MLRLAWGFDKNQDDLKKKIDLKIEDNFKIENNHKNVDELKMEVDRSLKAFVTLVFLVLV